MLGPGLLVRPVLAAGAQTVDTLLPRGARWYESLSGRLQEKSGWLKGDEQRYRLKVDMEAIPAFYRSGPRRAAAAGRPAWRRAAPLFRQLPPRPPSWG
jgi:alpha-glucosidase (family GH31 glycosyl hydrolase)